MKTCGVFSALMLVLALSAPVSAQTNVQDGKAAQAQTRAERKADKSQAKADRDEMKALKSRKMKKAERQQDMADRAASNVTTPH